MTIKNISVLETKFEFMEKHISELKENQNQRFDDMRDDHIRYMAKIEKIISDHIIEKESQFAIILEKLDQKYAAKWTERAMIFIGS